MFLNSETQKRLSEDFVKAAESGDAPRAQALLAEGVDPATQNSRALQLAAANGHAEIVRTLLDDGRADPAAANSAALRWALESGHIEIVLALLRDGRADPGLDDSWALDVAAERGYTDIVRMMLRDRRVDPAADIGNPLFYAALNGHADVVDILLHDGRAQNNPNALEGAAAKGYVGIVRALLDDRRTDPAANNSAALMQAVEYGRTEVVVALLDDGRAQPTDLDNFAIETAMVNGYTEMVRALLRDGRANPHADSLVLAAKRSHVDVVMLILAAMGAGTNDALFRVRQWFAEQLGYQALSPGIYKFFHACKEDPAMPRTLDLLQALLQTTLPTKTIIALAYEGARRNMSRETILQLETNGTLTSLLRSSVGPNAEIPAARDIEQYADLAAFASVTKAEPILHVGQAALDPAQYPQIIAALTPGLSPPAANAVWRMLRAQARGEEHTRTYGTAAERVRDRIASKVLLTAVVSEYNAVAADAKQLTQHKEPHLSAAANRFVLALNALGSAAERGDTAAIQQAQSHLQSTMQIYEKRIESVLGEAQYNTRAGRFQLMHAIIRLPAEQVAEFPRTQARGLSSRKGHAVEL